ncbi:cadherin domain-containing protein [Bremerella sp. JC770]|uniref:cadherin domain-containing protein n=1 Tax=Bremerella sp. JC770 TaxID=3232137 RepID=UPI00345A9A88
MRLESLEIRDLLAANTLDFVDNLEIGSPGEKRDLQLEVDASSGSAIVALRIQGTSGNLDPAIPLVFIQDTDRNNPANHVPLMQAMGNSNGTTDSLVLFEVSAGSNFTIEVGGTSGSGGFLAEVMLFGSTDADGTVSENEYMRAVAAELQARGVGNQNTAAYFQTVYGINFNESQYNPAYDANMNGKVDGWEVGYVESNMGGAPVILDLIGDNEAPAVEAAVAVDTGSSTTDNITMDTTGIIGTVTDFSTIVRAEVSIQGGKGGSIDLADPATLGTIAALSQGPNEITFTLDIDDLDVLLGSGVVTGDTVLNNGTFTLELTTEDELGNVSITPFTLDFEFDTDAPDQPAIPDLVDSSDSGDSDVDNLTNIFAPELTATAEVGSSVAFYSSIDGYLGSAIAGTGGVATITSPGLAEGNHNITVIATDAAGNDSLESDPLSLTIDTTPADDVENIVLTNSDLNANLTFDDYATFTGKTEADATVELLDSNSQVVATTTADGTTGEFAFVMGDNISLELGENNFWFVATDVAGNPSAKVAFDVFSNNPPTIDDPGILSVDENASKGTPIVTVVADSGDDNTDTLTYKIKSVDAGYESTFAINETTGQITVNDPAKLDFEDDSTGALQTFTLEIEVTDSKGDGDGGVGLSTTRTITIDLNDVNELPTFDQDPFELSVQENKGENTILDGGPISATDVDADDDEDGDLTYTITGGTGATLFAIDPTSGVVTVKADVTLDHEVQDTYTLEITVTDNLDGDGNGEVSLDNSGMPNSVTQTVTVSVIDVNETPEFVNDPFTFEVREDATTPQSLGFVEVSDDDIDDNITGSLTYTITPATDNGLFAIDSETGEITLTELGATTLNFEATNSYSLDIEVTDSVDTDGGEVGDTFTIMTTVTINVLDVNEAPTFDESPFEFTLAEDAAIDAEVGKITAADVDADDNDTNDLTFAIVDGDHSDYFEIDPVSGVIRVKDNSAFDFEEVDGMKSFTLDVTVTDNLDGESNGELGQVEVTSGTVTITLTNVNELPEEDTVDLGQITFELVNDGSDDANTGKMVVLADPDANDFITYDPTADGLNHFSIDASGNLIFNTTNPITQQQLDDASGTINFSIDVPISDQNGGMKTITVTFQVVENAPPVFQSPAANSSYDVFEYVEGALDNLDENTPIDDLLDIQATDPDSDPANQPIEDSGFSLASTAAYPDIDPNTLFEITTINGNRTIVVKDGSESLLRYDLLIADNATAEMEMIEGEMTAVATFTINIVATDPLGGVTERPIEIRVINRNDAPTFETPDEAPTVEEQVMHADPLNNNIVAGTPVYDLFEAFSDPDNFAGDMDHLSYEIVTGPYSGAFEIGGVIPGTESYELVVSDPSILNYETLLDIKGETFIDVQIKATDDAGETVTGTIRVQVEQKNELPIYDMIAPVEFDYDFLLTQANETVLEMEADVFAGQPGDPEQHELTYTQRSPDPIVEGDDEYYFSLDPNGNIVLENAITFGEMEEERTFVLNFDYQDSELLTTSNLGFAEGAFQLTIVVSKNQAPTFESADSFDIDENATGDGEVLLIEVSDPEMENITFELSDPQNAFTLVTNDAETGNGSFASASLKLNDASNLDHESLTDGKYELTVTATDEYGRMTTQTITVNVNDVNEAPVFTSSDTFSVPENSPLDTPVDTVIVTDEDVDDIPGTNLEFDITGGTGEGIFEIDPWTGVITVIDPSALDAEDQSKNSYTLEVSVTDNLDGANETGTVQTSFQTITINVTNVNEAPVKIADDPAPFLVDESDPAFENTTEGDTFEVRFDVTVSDFFEDPEMQNVLLQVDTNFDEDTPDFTAGGHIRSATFDNGTGELVVVFEYFGVDQNRAPVDIQLIATEAAPDSLQAADPLNVTIEVTNQTSVDFKIIPVLNPTFDNTEGFDGVMLNELPEATTRFADEQSFFVEIWGTTLVGEDDVALGNAWIEGFRNVVLQMTYRDDLVDLIDVVNPKAILGDEGDGANGVIENFNAFFGVVGDSEDDILDQEPPIADFGSIGGDGSYVRLGYLQFRAKPGVEVNNIDNLVEIDFDNAGTDVTLNGADSVDFGQGNDPEIGVPRTGDIEADIHESQRTLAVTPFEIVNAEKFTISSGHSEAVINVLGESTINGLDVQGQGGNTVGNVTNFTGSVFVLFSGSATDPDSFEIVGAELVLLDDPDGPFRPDIPSGEDDDPSSSGTDEANFGLEAFDDDELPTQVAIRETVIYIGGMPSVTFGPSDSPFDSKVSFDSSGFNYGIGSGFADVTTTAVVFGEETEFAGRTQLGGTMLGSNGTEMSSIEGNNSGGYVLTLSLERLIQKAFRVSPATANANLSFSGTVVATTGGAVPLQGTVYAKDGQPLEDGTGMFVTVNKNRTTTDANGQIAELPDSADWASEWDTLWVEVWGNTADALGVMGGSLDLAYNTDLFTATQIEYASSMTLNRTGLIDDANGLITGLGSQSEQNDLGNGQFVLLGRVKLESLADDGIDVSVGGDLNAESLGLVATNTQVLLRGIGQIDPDVTEVAEVDVWAVAYDANDDGKIGVTDFSQFISAYGRSTLTADNAMMAALDFDNSGKIGVGDFSAFIKNYGLNKSTASKIVYPETFTQMWVGKGVELNGPNTVQEVFDKAVSDWQEALGWEEPIDVKLVVKDFGDAQLGEAELLGLDENGLPQFGILTLDDDGAGLGWSSDLEGGPAEGQYDLYTVILHELGHLYGFMSHYAGFSDNVVTDHDGNKIFIGADFVAVLDDYAHHLDSTEHMGDVMNATLDPGQRKLISALDVQILQTAYDSATAGQTVTGGSAALHAAVTTETIVEETIVAPVVTQEPVAFVFDKVVDVESVSGRTGYEAAIAPAVYSELIRNGVRVTTSSSDEVKQQIEEFDSAVATLASEDTSLLLADSVEDSDYFTTEEDSTSVDDLFADWDFNSDLEG